MITRNPEKGKIGQNLHAKTKNEEKLPGKIKNTVTYRRIIVIRASPLKE